MNAFEEFFGRAVKEQYDGDICYVAEKDAEYYLVEGEGDILEVLRMVAHGMECYVFNDVVVKGEAEYRLTAKLHKTKNGKILELRWL